MINRARWAVLALAAGLTVAACSSGVAATKPPNLEGTKWRVVEIAGAPDVRRQPADGLVRQGPYPRRQRLQQVLARTSRGPGDDRRGVDQLDAAHVRGRCRRDRDAVHARARRGDLVRVRRRREPGPRRRRRRGAADRLALRTRVGSPSSARPSDGRAPRRGNPWNGVRKVRAPQRRVAGNARPP